MYIPHFLYSFICQWMFSLLFYNLAIMNVDEINMGILFNITFECLLYIFSRQMFQV